MSKEVKFIITSRIDNQQILSSLQISNPSFILRVIEKEMDRLNPKNNELELSDMGEEDFDENMEEEDGDFEVEE